MDPKTHLDPTKPCGQLKKEEQKIYNTQDQYDVYAADGQNVSFYVNTRIYLFRKSF